MRIFLAEAFFFIIIMNADKDFINIFNEFYPFERYIVRTPKSIEPVFDDLILTEIFVPKTEIKPIIHNDKLVCFTGVEYDEIYVKVRGVAGEIRIGYFGRTRQTLWSAVQMLTQKLCCQTIHDCPKVVPLHYESE